MEITVAEGREKDSPTLTVEYDIKPTLAENIETFGEDVVQSMFVAKAKIAIQDLVRRLMKEEDKEGVRVNDSEVIKQKVAEFKLGVVTRVKKSTLEKAADLMEGMSDDDLAALAKQIKEAKAAKKAA